MPGTLFGSMTTAVNQDNIVLPCMDLKSNGKDTFEEIVERTIL